MSEQKTHAEIIAEMREIAAEKYRLSSENGGAYGNPGVYYLDFAQFVHVIADRLEAAHKREVGDAAKLREALKHIKDRLPHMLQYMRVHWEDASSGGYFDELMLVIDAALAAPPRNCDKYSHDEALQVWASEKGNEHNGCFDEWLYEIAKDGGVK